MWDSPIQKLPEGYTPIHNSFPKKDDYLLGDFPTEGPLRAEVQHLIRNFKPRYKKIGVCIETINATCLQALLAVISKYQQSNKLSRFYISTPDEDILLALVEVFRFFIPEPKVYRNLFYIVPNIFYTNLTKEERLWVDIKILSLMNEVIISKHHPKLKYIKHHGSPLINHFPPKDAFVFNVEGEAIL